MPAETKTTWTCTRCGATREYLIEDASHVRGRPSEWAQVVVPEGSADLCEDCLKKMTRFLKGAELEQHEGIPFVPTVPPLLDGYPQEHVGYWDGENYLPLSAMPHHDRNAQLAFITTTTPLFAIKIDTPRARA